MTKTASITYYASNRTKYFKNKTELTKYVIHTIHETVEVIGTPDILNNLGETFAKYYSENSSNMRMHNCTVALEERGFRKLSGLEERILLQALKGESQSAK